MQARFFSLENNMVEVINQKIKQYCESNGYDFSLLTEQEIAQLAWSQGNVEITPEVRGQDNGWVLNFEIQRALARFFSFQDLLQGNYSQFVSGQKTPALSLAAFNSLATEAQSLNEDSREAIRASCFLVMSPAAVAALSSHPLTESDPLPNDSEEFVTLMAKTACLDKNIFPLTSRLSSDQLVLLEKAFWSHLHFRHMLYMEGSTRMTQPMADAVRDGQFDSETFSVWKWRWLTNIFGFSGGPHAKYFNAESAHLVNGLIPELEEILINPEHDWMERRLETIFEKLCSSQPGITDLVEKLDVNEKKFIALLALHFHSLSLFKPDRILTPVKYSEEKYDSLESDAQAIHFQALLEGYLDVREQHGVNVSDLAAIYRKNTDAITPTYVPAVINGVYWRLINRHNHLEENAIRETIAFCTQLFGKFYSLDFDRIISCRNLADTRDDAQLAQVLTAWLKDPRSVDFVLDDAGNINCVPLQCLNFALVPESADLAAEFCDLSKALSSGSDYCLGEESFGHVTVNQMYLPFGVDTKRLWDDVIEAIGEFRSGVELSLNDTKSKDENGYVWLQLQVDRENGLCDEIHRIVTGVLDAYGIKSLNKTGLMYDPHFTLSHTTDEGLKDELGKIKLPLSGHFRLVLGASGKAWQLEQILIDSAEENVNRYQPQRLTMC